MDTVSVPWDVNGFDRYHRPIASSSVFWRNGSSEPDLGIGTGMIAFRRRLFPSRERAMFEKLTHHRRNGRPFLRISSITLVLAVFGAITSGRAPAVLTARADSRLIRLQTMPSTIRLPVEGKLPSLGNATAWINSEPLTAASRAWQSCPGRVLDLFLHQLAAPTWRGSFFVHLWLTRRVASASRLHE